MAVKKQILEAIKQHETIIVHRHQRPDPDALGSQGGLVEIIRASYPEKKVYQVGGSIENLTYLTLMDEIDESCYQAALVIVTDTANAPRISDGRYSLGSQLIKIDHHPDDEPYGDLSWVNTQASSCSEMIFDFYDLFKNELTLTQEGARLLFAGIVGDTGRFMYPSTTAHTLEVASRLMSFGIDVAKINRQISEITVNVAKLSGYVLQNMVIDKTGAAMVIIPHQLLVEYGVTDAATGALIPLPGEVDKVISWGIFVEQPEGYYRVRLRSKGPKINELAKAHHGGGHPLASGANAKDLAEVTEMFEELKKLALNG